MSSMNTEHTRRRKLLPEMEGSTARRYARLRDSEPQREENRRQATRFASELAPGAAVLEVAPGPGYLAVELARVGLRVTGLDISRTMIEIATEYAERSGVGVTLRQGDVTELPFPDGAFDLVVCQAAFKNFVRPVTALDEMHRVLRPGGQAVIQDLNRTASRADVAEEVRWMRLRGLNAAFTKLALAMLRRRAYTPAGFEDLARQSAFGRCTVSTERIGIEVRLTRRE